MQPLNKREPLILILITEICITSHPDNFASIQSAGSLFWSRSNNKINIHLLHSNNYDPMFLVSLSRVIFPPSWMSPWIEILLLRSLGCRNHSDVSSNIHECNKCLFCDKTPHFSVLTPRLVIASSYPERRSEAGADQGRTRAGHCLHHVQ